MTEGKLVRDLVPALIRESGRQAEVRYLAGAELTNALVAKLCEEAREAAEAVDQKERLVEELADVTEVMSALMRLFGIHDDDVADAAKVKALQRGRFETGAFWSGPQVHPPFTVADVDAHKLTKYVSSVHQMRCVRQVHPVTVWVGSPEPPHTGNLVFDAKVGDFCCDGGDIGHDESELHSGDWSVARREKLQNGTGLSDLTVDQVRSA